MEKRSRLALPGSALPWLSCKIHVTCIRSFQPNLYFLFPVQDRPPWPLPQSTAKLSRTKLQKILISGGRWSTERSRAIQHMYREARMEGMSPKAAMKKISAELRISTVAVNINLPYEKVVYKLAQKSRNAQRIEKCRGK